MLYNTILDTTYICAREAWVGAGRKPNDKMYWHVGWVVGVCIYTYYIHIYVYVYRITRAININTKSYIYMYIHTYY